MKSDPRTDPLGDAAVAGLHRNRFAAAVGWTAEIVLLVAVPLVILFVASLAALLVVRVGSDLRIGLDPLIEGRFRPRLSLYELARRAVEADLLRQGLIVVLVIGAARAADGAAWRRRLGLTRPAEPRRPIQRIWLICLLLMIWPAIHIAWVAGTAAAFHLPFGQNVRASPFLTDLLFALSLTYATLLAPIAEELLMRGEAFARASAIMRPAGAITSTALLFCVLHVGFSLDGDLHPRLDSTWYARPLTLLPLAITLGWLRWRTGRLWPCMLLHTWSNTALIAYLMWPKIAGASWGFAGAFGRAWAVL